MYTPYILCLTFIIVQAAQNNRLPAEMILPDCNPDDGLVTLEKQITVNYVDATTLAQHHNTPILVDTIVIQGKPYEVKLQTTTPEWPGIRTYLIVSTDGEEITNNFIVTVSNKLHSNPTMATKNKKTMNAIVNFCGSMLQKAVEARKGFSFMIRIQVRDNEQDNDDETEEYFSSMKDLLQGEFIEEYPFDCKILTGNGVAEETIPAHRLILAAQSEYFRARFCSGSWSENAETYLPEFTYDVVSNAIKFIYTKSVDEDFEPEKGYQLARFLLCKSYAKFCRMTLMNNLTPALVKEIVDDPSLSDKEVRTLAKFVKSSPEILQDLQMIPCVCPRFFKYFYGAH